jgi:hypothetical protein
MRAISRRLNKLEQKLGMAPGDRLLMVVRASATKLALDKGSELGAARTEIRGNIEEIDLGDTVGLRSA